jgi:uncharacterized protein YfaS (alpha-2-macroglobulin family)
MTLRTTLLAALLASCAFHSAPERSHAAVEVSSGVVQDLATLRAEAERLLADGSYARANEIYARALPLAAGTPDERWVRFRLADTRWRALAGTEQADPSGLEAAQRELEGLVRDVRRDDEKDRVWAEVHESLGDLHWTTRWRQDWGQAWPSYDKALQWWGGSSELELARERYLGIVWRTAAPAGLRGWEYGSWVHTPDPVIENAIRVAEDLDDRARAHVLRAITLQNRGGNLSTVVRVAREFEAALEGGREQPWYDDALYAYAQWLESRGPLVRDEQGRFVQRPDYERALELYRRLESEFEPSESRFHDQARRGIERISAPRLSVTVDRVFEPGTEAFVHAQSRNVREIELELHAVDPIAGYRLADGRGDNWTDAFALAGQEPVARWKQAVDGARHHPSSRKIEIERRLAPGAYVLVASASGVAAVRELLLVTETHLVLETDGRRVLAWVTSSELGVPVAGARVRLWEETHQDRVRIRSLDGATDANGLATFELSDERGYRQLLAFAAAGERVAYARVGGHRHDRASDEWRVQAITDRPTYRPEDTVRWKLVARRRADGKYSTPAGERVHAVITDPQGNQVREETLRLSDFGSASGELALDASMPLGEYGVQLRLGGSGGEWIGAATLFRLEEYKLPEFEVTVSPASDDGVPRTYRAGDEVEATISAQAYAGGAIAGAKVEVVVFQRPLWHVRPFAREFPWLHGDDQESSMRWRGWGETEILRKTLATDAQGLASVEFLAPLEAQQDLEFRIEARVTDASRREVTGEGRVRVGRQGYTVSMRPRSNVHGPGDTVEVDVEARDANGRPVKASGDVSIVRLRWYRVWRDATGREIDDEDHEELARAGGPTGFVVARSDYRREVVLRKPLAVDASGKATFSFEANGAGCYSIEWRSADVDGSPIEAATSVWVADPGTRDLAWRRGEIEIVLDRDTLRAGEDAVVLLTSASGPAAVLLTVGSTELHSWQVVELTGSAKLVRIPLDERHVPNAYLRAQVVRRGQVWLDQEEVVVPPYDHFLTVEVEPERPEVKPGETTAFRVRAKGHDGEPVAAELAFAVIDESVLAIQGDYAVDPRRFFFGDRKALEVQSGATSHERRYAISFVEEELRQANARGGSDEHYLGEKVSRQRAEGKREGDFAETSAPTPETAMSKSRDDAPLADLGYLGAAPGGTGGAITVRSDFRATAFWKADLVTGADGAARVEVPMPQSLTRWRASAHAATSGSAFGQGEGSTRTNLPLTVRLQAPRFFVVGDVCTISALVDNRGERDLEADVALLRGAGDDLSALEPRKVRVAAGATERVEWTLELEQVGRLRLQARAGAGDLADAMERTYDVHERGIDQLVAKSGKLAGGSGTIRFDVPAERKPGTTSLVVAVTPSTAATMLDALPYLIDYPYGCVEQTMSRFLPSAIVARTLAELGLDAEAAMGRVFGGVEGEYASRTHPKGKKSLELVDAVTRASLERLYGAQHSGGFWGWWPGAEEGDLFMTAYVVWGLSIARDAGLAVETDRLEAAARWLDAELVEAEVDPDLAAWMLHALAAERSQVGSRSFAAASGNLWASRDRLNAYGRALFALAAHGSGQEERARALCDALANGAIVDRTPDTSVVERTARASDPAAMATAHWGNDGLHWRWNEGAVESTSTVLRALLAIRPDHELVEPAMNWLVRNRRGAQWSSTRDTAIAVLALTEYLKRSGEAEAEVAFEVRVAGRVVGSRSYARGEALSAPARFPVDPALVRDGANEIEIVRTGGTAPLYFAVEARSFTREKPIRASGNEVFVRREYFALVPRETLLQGYVHDRVALADGGRVDSGTRIETVITLEAKNDLEYLIVEDLKPAGLEAAALTSGGPAWMRELRSDAQALRIAGTARGDDAVFTGRTSWTHQELRDRKVVSFVAKLPQGVWELRYEMRAEVPGRFQALPAIAQAMYVPEIRGNDREQALEIR